MSLLTLSRSRDWHTACCRAPSAGGTWGLRREEADLGEAEARKSLFSLNLRPPTSPATLPSVSSLHPPPSAFSGSFVAFRGCSLQGVTGFQGPSTSRGSVLRPWSGQNGVPLRSPADAHLAVPTWPSGALPLRAPLTACCLDTVSVARGPLRVHPAPTVLGARPRATHGPIAGVHPGSGRVLGFGGGGPAGFHAAPRLHRRAGVRVAHGTARLHRARGAPPPAGAS